MSIVNWKLIIILRELIFVVARYVIFSSSMIIMEKNNFCKINEEVLIESV